MGRAGRWQKRSIGQGAEEVIEQIAGRAKGASIRMAALSSGTKNSALRAIAEGLRSERRRILQANDADVARARKDNVKPALLKRLRFDERKLAETIAQIESLARLEDPVGRTLSCTELDERLELYKVSCPIGVLGVVFESRPDALVQISTLALKSGNAVLLKGGAEAARTNAVLAEIIAGAASRANLPDGWLALLETREDVKRMLAMDGFIDLVIPRGSNEFVKYTMDNTRIPVLGHAEGLCHVYVDGGADLDMAVRIAFDSKCQYPAVCNAAETLLVAETVAEDFLPRIKARYDEADVEMRGDSRTREIIEVEAAREEDWRTEYNDLVIAVKVVGGPEEAIGHINRFGSHHTDAIVTEDEQTARRFLQLVDSADVFWNCSTRFSDGYRYGLGAEVGISTNKIHARGPVGLEGLVIYKWLMVGRGQVVADYSGQGKRVFTHRKLDAGKGRWIVAAEETG